MLKCGFHIISFNFFIFSTVDDNLDDIVDGTHKCFMKQYLKNWPFPHLTHYKIGQSINVDLNGVLAKCTVDAVDCSLMQVVFEVSIFFWCVVFYSDLCLFFFFCFVFLWWFTLICDIVFRSVTSNPKALQYTKEKKQKQLPKRWNWDFEFEEL